MAQEKLGRFRIQKLLGTGGMGKVYLAEDRELHQSVALKFLSHLDPASYEFFQEEVKLLARLSHPNLVKIFDFFSSTSQGGDFPSGPFFSMEYIPGQALQRPPKNLAAEQWIDVFVQLCQGLHYLHSRNILHRDLKPANVFLTSERQVKLLDFGLSAVPRSDSATTLPRGTMIYLPPEAFWGEYDAQSDLFALGVLFYEVLTGQLPYSKPLTQISKDFESPPPLKSFKPDLPDFFCDLIHRLLELNHAKRPHSALSLIRYINQHVEIPFPIIEEVGSQAIVQKVPLVGREKKIRQFQQAVESSLQEVRPRFLILRGPTGIGRTRFLEELKWGLQLKGIRFEASSDQTVVTRCQEWFGPMKGKALVLAFCDLQNWNSSALQQLQLLLSLVSRKEEAFLFILEFNDELISSPLNELLTFARSSVPQEEIVLQDLSEADAQQLVRLATLDAPIPDTVAHQIVEGAGGRPLLLLEAIRCVLSSGEGKVSPEKFRKFIPKNLKEVSDYRIKGLSQDAQTLLAIVLSHPQTVAISQALELWPHPTPRLEDALFELDQKGMIRPRSTPQGGLVLTHPSLRDAYLVALPSSLVLEAHRLWEKFFLQKISPDREIPGPDLIFLAEHAHQAGDHSVVKKFGMKVAELCVQQGQDLKALEWYQRLLKLAETPLDYSHTYANLAPLYFRLGRFDDALKAYDLWFQDRVDDETFLQKVKHRFYTGLVYYSAGQATQARQRLEESLKIGNSEKFPAHRPYHARAHMLLGALDRQAGAIQEAREHLRKALLLAEDIPILLGEIEQRLGTLELSEIHFEEAIVHFQQSFEWYRQAKRPQAEAIALDAIGLIYRDQGRLKEALPRIDAAIDLTQQCGEILQEAQYRENRALVFLDLGRYAEALEEMEEARGVLEALGKEEDKILIQIHHALLYGHLGNFEKSGKIIERLQQKLKSTEEPGVLSSFYLLSAEEATLARQYEKAQAYFQKGLTSEGAKKRNLDALSGWIGLCRCALHLTGSLEGIKDLEELIGSLSRIQGPIFSLWYAVLHDLQKKPHELKEKDFFDLLGRIQNCENPETRIDLYELLALRLKKAGLQTLPQRLRESCRVELDKIANPLPEELKMDFEKNRDLKSLDQTLSELMPSRSSPQESLPVSEKTGSDFLKPKISESRFRQYSEINRQLAQKIDLKEILERVMDAAIELTGAERGFLLLKNEKAKAKFLTGFEVKTARHLNQGSLEEDEFKFSMSAVKQAVNGGTYLLTDNAQLDPRFQEKKSVVQYQLKSILVVPLDIEGKILGAVYLDHRYQPQCFSEEDVVLLTAFASQAALAIQKAQMLLELQAAKKQLEQKVEDQAVKIETISGELAQMRDQLRYGYEEMVGQSPAMMKVFQLLDHVTETTIPVWICGESGTGKELVARSLHFNSPRKDGPFVSENCSAIPETLLESELFGHKKGAFTHADRDRVGLFEQAHRGTLFLDEIADMSLGMQVKLLRVLQEGEIRPLGTGKKIKVDVRLVTASNRDLNQWVKEGKFRQDLFFRINGLTIKLPPLRERKDDIPLLVDHIVKKVSREFNLKPSEVSDETFQALVHYSWPGNIRELEGVMRNALLFAKGRVITPEFLSFGEGLSGQGSTAMAKGGEASARSEEESEERQLILDALRRHAMDKEAVAKELDISLRSLYTRMERLNIPKKKTVLAKYLGI